MIWRIKEDGKKKRDRKFLKKKMEKEILGRKGKGHRQISPRIPLKG
jgi:hypothetical protein